jgi:hypothetical protein
VKNKRQDLTTKIKQDLKPKLKKKTYFGPTIKPNAVCGP